MLKWFFDSIGMPIAFAIDDAVWTPMLKFVGYIEGNQVWHVEYKGEVIFENRLV
jgi:hypothetical protein